jgi:hypothetical protein
MTVFEREYEAVEGQLEEPVGVVADPCALDTCQCGVAIRRKGLLRLAVCVIPPSTSPPGGQLASASA